MGFPALDATCVDRGFEFSLLSKCRADSWFPLTSWRTSKIREITSSKPICFLKQRGKKLVFYKHKHSVESEGHILFTHPYKKFIVGRKIPGTFIALVAVEHTFREAEDPLSTSIVPLLSGTEFLRASCNPYSESYTAVRLRKIRARMCECNISLTNSSIALINVRIGDHWKDFHIFRKETMAWIPCRRSLPKTEPRKSSLFVKGWQP